MKKRFAKILSLALALIMVLSVLPTAALAQTTGTRRTTVLTDWADWIIGWIIPRPKPRPTYPAQTLSFEGRGGTLVSVDAPAGALPANTSLEINDTINATVLQDAYDRLADERGTVLKAVDISFLNSTGNEVEPRQAVTVTLSSDVIAELDEFTLVHFDCSADELGNSNVHMEVIEDCYVSGSTVTFEATDFSVYAIIGDPVDPDTKRMTYWFYESYTDETDNTPYWFTDAAGVTTNKQILKNGDALEEVGTPITGTTLNRRFVGWFINGTDTEVRIGEAQTITENGEIILVARFQDVINIFYLSAADPENGSRSVVETMQVPFTPGSSDTITVDTNGVTTIAADASHAFIGWNRDEDEADAGIVESADGIIDITDEVAANDLNITIFPALASATWLYFDENDGGSGGGASYTPSQFVVYGGVTIRPTDPNRPGYTFGGWYENPECTGAQFTFGNTLPTNKTLYAKWVPGPANYTVIIWVQKTADSAGVFAQDNGQNIPVDNRTYDFYQAIPVASTTGATATVANTYKNLRIDQYNHIDYSRCDADKTVAANGSTVMNVWYDRDVMSIEFHQSTSYYGNPTGNIVDTWYGLYDATFEESGTNWQSPREMANLDYDTWRSSTYEYTFLSVFKSFDNDTDSQLVVGPTAASGNCYFVFLKQSINNPDEYYIANYSRTTRTADLNLSEKYNGFQYAKVARGYATASNYTVTAFSRTQNFSTPSLGSSIEIGGQNNSNYNALGIYYDRKSYNLQFINGLKGAGDISIRTDSVKYEASLENYAAPVAKTDFDYPNSEEADHYEFIGWFADPTWTTLVTFRELTASEKEQYTSWYGIGAFSVLDQMPNKNVALYAGWAKAGYDVALNPNGGQLKVDGVNSQAGIFWVEYDGKLDRALLTDTTREGYELVDWIISTVDGELIWGYDEYNHRQVTDFSNWTMGTEPWNFDNGIKGPLYLTALWYAKAAIQVVYDVGEGQGSVTDSGRYKDNATAIIYGAPTAAPEGMFFVGWDIVGSDATEHYMPGQDYTIDADYAVDDVITLRAVYSRYQGFDEPVPVTHIYWFANNDTDSVKMVTEISLNEAVEIPTPTNYVSVSAANTEVAGTALVYAGYKFIGWARVEAPKDTDGNYVSDPQYVAHAELDEDDLFLKWENGQYYAKDPDNNDEWAESHYVAADEHMPYHDLYAVWVGFTFYVYHSSDCTVEAITSSGVFDITAKVPDGYLYGGYYSDYAWKSEGFDPAALTFENGIATDEDGTPYETPDLDNGPWNRTNAYEASGLEMVPEENAVYYLKEVDADKYLRPYLHYTYDLGDNFIRNAWLISDIDDLNYNGYGFVIANGYLGATACTSLKITNATGGSSVTLTAQRVFRGAGVKKGYLTYAQVINIGNGNHTNYLVGDDGSNAVLQYWITPDGLFVTGNTCRQYTGTGYANTISAVTVTDNDWLSVVVEDYSGLTQLNS